MSSGVNAAYLAILAATARRTFLTWPGALYYAIADDAHNDGAGKCDALADRVFGYSFAQATSGSRFAILAAGNASGLTNHLTLQSVSGGGLLTLSNTTPAGALNTNAAYTLAAYFSPFSLGTEASLMSHNAQLTGGVSQVSAILKSGSTAGIGVTTQSAAGATNANIAFTKALGFHSWIWSYDGAGTLTAYYDGTSQGTAAVSPTRSGTMTQVDLGALRGVHHQWFAASSASSSADAASLHTLFAAAAA